MPLTSDDLLTTASEILDCLGTDTFLLQLGEVLDRRTGLGMFQTQAVNLATGQPGDTFFSRGYAMGVVSEYERWVLGSDPRVPAIAAEPGVFRPCWQWVDTEKFEKSEIVNEWLDRPEIDMRWGAAGLVPVDGETAIVLAAMRPRRQGAHDEREAAPMSALLPFVAKAAALHLRIRDQSGAQVAFLDMCSRRGEAAFLLSADLTLVGSNAEAEALLDAGTILLSRGRLRLPNRRDEVALLAALAAALQPPDRSVAERPFPIGAGHLQLPARVMGLGGLMASAGFPAKAAAALVVTRQDVMRPKQVDLSAFGLTPRESELALALAAGETLSEYASRRRVAVGTVRTQLKICLQKLGVRRQTDLVRLVLTLL